MERNNWKFQYTVAGLLEAAKLKREFFQKRVAFWEDKKKEVIEKIKSEGIEIDESLAAGTPSFPTMPIAGAEM